MGPALGSQLPGGPKGVWARRCRGSRGGVLAVAVPVVQAVELALKKQKNSLVTWITLECWWRHVWRERGSQGDGRRDSQGLVESSSVLGWD